MSFFGAFAIYDNLGYSVTYEFSINVNGYGSGKPISYQASVIPWQDNIGVKYIGDYYIK